MVPGPGLEPGYSASKADVLPIRRSRNGCKRATYIMPQGAHEGQIGRVEEHLRASSVQRLAEASTSPCVQPRRSGAWFIIVVFPQFKGRAVEPNDSKRGC